MTDPKWFAGRLRELREQAGLTQQELADKAGLTREGVAQLETGRRSPAWATVLQVCDALGISSEEFRKPPSKDAPPRGRPRKAAAQTEAEEIESPSAARMKPAEGKGRKKSKEA